MKKLAVTFALLGCLVTVPAAAQCVFCDTAQPSGQPWCNYGAIGMTLCYTNAGHCWTGGSSCGQGEIDRVSAARRTPGQRMTMEIAQRMGSVPLTQQEIEDIVSECNRTPGCQWVYAGQWGGYGQTWGRIKVLYR